MMWNYIRFDFGESYFRSVSVLDLVLEKMPVSISLGLWITLLSYLISIPLGIRKALKDGSTLRHLDLGRHHRRLCDPGLPLRDPAHRALCRRLVLSIFPLRGPHLRQLGASLLLAGARSLDYFWHLTLPLIALSLSAFATTTLLTKNSFLDEIRKQYVMTARAKGLTERRVLYGHVFRNAMLIIVAGFPGAFISAFFARLAAHRDDLLARRARPARLRERLRARLSGGVRHPLHLLADRSRDDAPLRPHLHLDRSAHRLREAGGLMDRHAAIRTRRTVRRRKRVPERRRGAADAGATRPASRRWRPPRRSCARACRRINQRRLAELQGQPARLWSLLDLPRPLRRHALRRVRRQRPAAARLLQGRVLRPALRRLSGGGLRRLPAGDELPRPLRAGRDRRQRLDDLAADPLFLPTVNNEIPTPAPSRALLDLHEGGALRALSARRRRSRTAPSATRTGSAPTTRRATCWRG